MRPEKDRALAETLFVTEGKSAREIAAHLGVGKETVQRWAREGKWTERRRQRRSDSPLAALERLRRERDRLIGTLGGDQPAAKDAAAAKDPAGPKDAASETISKIHKLTQTIEKMESHREDTDIDAMLDVVERLATFTAAHADAEELEAVRKIIEMFLDEERRKSL
jgi:uncharacterized protein YjcR